MHIYAHRLLANVLVMLSIAKQKVALYLPVSESHPASAFLLKTTYNLYSGGRVARGSIAIFLDQSDWVNR